MSKPISSFPPEYKEFFKSCLKSERKIELKDKSAGTYFRQQLYQYRAALRAENTELAASFEIVMIQLREEEGTYFLIGRRKDVDILAALGTSESEKAQMNQDLDKMGL